MNRRDFILAWAAFLAACREGMDNEAAAAGMHELPAVSAMPAARVGGDAALSSAAGDPLAPALPVLGINSHHLLDHDLRVVRELGITHVRSTLVVQLWTDHPTYAVSVRENTARVSDYGLKLLYVVHNVHGPVFRLRHDPAEARRFTGVVGQMMRALPTVESWQLWNEQDVWVQAPFGAGERPPQRASRVGENYARWWREAYPMLKGIRPEALLVTGAPADHADDRWRDFLRTMIGSGIEADAIGFHAYGPWERSGPMIAEARRIVAGRAPIWVTECGGRPGPHWSPEYHARAWRTVIEGNEREQLAERLYPYALQTDPADPWYGLYEVDGRPRPALEWLRRRN